MLHFAAWNTSLYGCVTAFNECRHLIDLNINWLPQLFQDKYEERQKRFSNYSWYSSGLEYAMLLHYVTRNFTFARKDFVVYWRYIFACIINRNMHFYSTMHYKTCLCGCFECRKYSLKLSCKSINPLTSVYIMHEIFANTPEKANH